MTEERATLVEPATVPGDIYIGTNVVHRHIFEFFDLAANQMLLSEGEAVLAIFDCVILDDSGRRLGGLTLHDYAVLTSQNLITWGRGRSKDIVDKFRWSDIALDKFGRRTPIEGVIKVLYKSRPVGTKRRISVRSNHEARLATNGEKIPPANSGVGISLYLDLMPAGDVRPCAEMMRYLMGVSEGVPSADSFHTRFRNEVLESQRRMREVSLVLQPFYVDAGNGVLIEKDAEEERVYRSMPRQVGTRAERIPAASPYRGGTTKQGVVSPYRGIQARQGVASPYRGSSSQARSNKIAALPTRNANVVVSMDVAESPAAGSTLNRGNRRTSTGAPGKLGSESGQSSTVSLSNQPFSGPSKLDSYDRRVTGSSRLENAPMARSTPPPAPRPEPVARPAVAERSVPPPVKRPVPPSPTQSLERIRPAETNAAQTGERTRSLTPPVVERLVPEHANYDRALAMPIAVAIPATVLNIYTISRLARGLWIQPQNLGRNVSDLSETLGIVGDVIGLIATDADARRLAVSRLKYAVDRGPLASNLILHYTIWPFIKPVIDWVALPRSDADYQVYNRVMVRGGNLDEVTDEILGDAGLPDMGVMAGNDNPSQPIPPAIDPLPPVPMPRVQVSSPVPPVPMPHIQISSPVPAVPMPRPEPPRQTIAPKPKAPPAEPIPVKRQPIGDLGMGQVTFGSDELSTQTSSESAPPPPPIKGKLGGEDLKVETSPTGSSAGSTSITAKEMQDSSETKATPPTPPSKLGEGF